MRFQIKTRVVGHHRDVLKGFDQSLLLQLTPPGMRMQLVHCDPSDLPGGYIHIRVTVLGIWRQEWENVFSDYDLGLAESHFVDTGRRLPFPFKSWRHDHRVLADGPDHAIINDDVTFGTGFFLLDWMLWPIMWLQFAYRRPIYRRIFGRA